jgi:hypothetical protein
LRGGGTDAEEEARGTAEDVDGPLREEELDAQGGAPEGQVAVPRGRLKSIAPNRRKAYEAMGGSGLSKASRARIANAGKSAAGRKRMAKKAAATRKKKRRR